MPLNCFILAVHFAMLFETSGVKLSQQMIDIFKRDGVILIRNVIQDEELQNAINAARNIKTQVKIPNYDKISFSSVHENEFLMNVAIKSKVPAIVAELLGIKGDRNELRVLKDAVLGFRPGQAGCGWHVDDKGFWPSTDDMDGINVWIALDEYKASHGGGLAVAPTSHEATFAKAAREAIKSSTCSMATLSPECNEQIESLRIVYDMQPGMYLSLGREVGQVISPNTFHYVYIICLFIFIYICYSYVIFMFSGDAIMHTRYCFHRSDDFSAEGVAAFAAMQRSYPLLRYSIRYMPATSTVAIDSIEKPLPPTYTDDWETLCAMAAKKVDYGDKELETVVNRVLQALHPSSHDNPLTLSRGGRSLKSLGFLYPKCFPEPDPLELMVTDRHIRSLNTKSFL